LSLLGQRPSILSNSDYQAAQPRRSRRRGFVIKTPGSKPPDGAPEASHPQRTLGWQTWKTKTPVTANKVEADTGIFIPRKSGELFKTMKARRTEYCKGCLQIKDLRGINLERVQVDDGRVTL